MLILIALIPFAALGIGIGHLLNDDAMGPAMGGGVVAVRLPRRHVVPDHRRAAASRSSCQLLPSYWLVQAGHVGLGGDNPWTMKAWIVIAVWAAAMTGVRRVGVPARHPAGLTSRSRS